jgi:hypothetical protein
MQSLFALVSSENLRRHWLPLKQNVSLNWQLLSRG